jgi:hypothetical protein
MTASANVPAVIEARDLAPAIADGAAADQAVAALAEFLLALVVTRENTDEANRYARGIRDYRKALEDSRAGYSRQPRDELERIRSCYRGAIEKLDSIYAHLTTGVARVVQAERAEQQRALAAAAASGAGAAEIARAVQAVAPKPSQTRELVQYSAKVVDASKIPAEFWKIDLDALNAAARERKDSFSVPGAELIKDVRIIPL